MEARLGKLLCALLLVPALMGADFRPAKAVVQTDNFVVSARTPEIARQVAKAAEHYRKQLAIEWLGYELPRWAAKCPVNVQDEKRGAGGATTFSFFPNGKGSAEVCNWDMQIQGPLERILDSVLPHEVSHTIFACHFRRPLPRWADEGAATLAEHESEKRRQVLTVQQVMGTQRRIPLKKLLAIKDYPTDMQDVMTLYAEGYSLVDLLIQEGGRPRFLKFLADANQPSGWEKAVEVHYGYRGVAELEKRWQGWVMAGSPELELPQGQQYAAVTKGQRPAPAAQGMPIVRGQKPAEDPFLEDSAVAMEETHAPRVAQAALAGNSRTRTIPVPGRAMGKGTAVVTSFEPAAEPVGIAKSNAAKSAQIEEHENPRRLSKSKASVLTADTEHKLASKNSQEELVAETRISATMPRQVTEWSEFPQDPRPSPFARPGRNRNGIRP